MQSDRHYRVRKAVEWKYVRGWQNTKIADELGVEPETVSRYLNDPPDELKEPIESFKDDLAFSTMERLRSQLQEANDRARNAESPQKVFEFDDDGNLLTEEIHFEGGGSKLVPKVEGMEMQPDEKVRYQARREEREIIQMLWKLAGVESPEKRELSTPDGETGFGTTVVLDSEYVDDE
jgi:hypothetical protein